MEDVELLVNSALFFLSPHLYHASKLAMDGIKIRARDGDEFLVPMVQEWPSVYSGMAIIRNRTTRSHRDLNGGKNYYDALVSAGNHVGAYFKVHELGARFAYGPGTMILFFGRVLQHSVGKWVSGDRICLSHFIRKAVLKKFGQEYDDFPNINVF